MLQWLKDLFSGWYRKATITTRSELEQYIDKRVEELLEPEHWERATTDVVVHKAPDWDFVALDMCGMRIYWSAALDSVYVEIATEKATMVRPGLRSDLKLKFQKAFTRTWPAAVPRKIEPLPAPSAQAAIAKLERDRKAAGCPGHEQPSPMESK